MSRAVDIGIGYTLATARLFCPIAAFCEYAEELLGRPVLTHELGAEETWVELRVAFEDATQEAVSDNDNDLLGQRDATIWAARFVERVTANPAIAADEGAMLAWFAGAIETGYDQGRLAVEDDGQANPYRKAAS